MNEEGGVLKILAFMQRSYLIKHKRNFVAQIKSKEKNGEEVEKKV